MLGPSRGAITIAPTTTAILSSDRPIVTTIVEHFCEQQSEVYFIDINIKASKQLISKIKKKGFRSPKFIECNIL